MTVGILKEPNGENRVSLLPEQADALIKKKVNVSIETGAGRNAYANDEMYVTKNVSIISRDESVEKFRYYFIHHRACRERYFDYKTKCHCYWSLSAVQFSTY